MRAALAFLVCFVAAVQAVQPCIQTAVYAFSSTDATRVWQLNSWFKKAAILGQVDNATLSIHISQHRRTYGTQVKMCLQQQSSEVQAADRQFRCQLRLLSQGPDPGMILNLGRSMGDMYTYNVPTGWPPSNLLPMGIGKTKVSGATGWEPLLRPMTYEGGVDDLNCQQS